MVSLQGLNWQDHHFTMTNWFYKYKWSEPATQIAILAKGGYDRMMFLLKDKMHAGCAHVCKPF